MNKKSLFKVFIVLVLAAVLLFFFWSALVILALPVWIYLVWQVWKKKRSLFYEQMEPKSAERRFRWLISLLLIAGILLLLGILGFIMHNVSYAKSGEEEAIFFLLALVSLPLFVVSTTSSLLLYLKVRREWAREIWRRLRQ